uniref:Uncharacterized protein n=1 Tax=Sparus aurata TaxID=8175 RepID=A0A671YCW1_SPAAU
MGSWRVYIFWTLLCATRLFYSYAHIQTEEYKAKHLPFFTMTEDNNENSRAFREFLGRNTYQFCIFQINDLHEVLERLQNNQFPALRKKHGYLPVCDPGDQCALRRGSRIGKLCDCSPPRTCNSFLHRCL